MTYKQLRRTYFDDIGAIRCRHVEERKVMFFRKLELFICHGVVHVYFVRDHNYRDVGAIAAQTFVPVS